MSGAPYRGFGCHEGATGGKPCETFCGNERHCVMHAPAARTPTLLDAVEALLRIHDEPAGFVGKYGKELDKAIQAQQAKVDAAVALARAALVAHPTQPAVQTKVEISADPELLSRVMRAETELALRDAIAETAAAPTALAVLKQALAALENVQGIDTETECVTIDVSDEIAALRALIGGSPEGRAMSPERIEELRAQADEYADKTRPLAGDLDWWAYRDECFALAVRAETLLNAIPAGWRLAPIEPTEEMWTAGRDPVMFRDLNFHIPDSLAAPPWRINPATGKVETDHSKGTTAVHVWRAMVNAAPKYPAD